MPVDEAPDDDSNVRQSYNFAPGYHGLVYRADCPETGGQQEDVTGDTKYKLQSMQWGMLVQMSGCVPPLTACDRSCAILDEAQPRLRVQNEDHQLPRRLSH
jgi:hypothetical protein